MHSRIYQISPYPIDKADYLTEGFFFNTEFLSIHADYVNSNTNRETDIELLKSILHYASWSDDGNSFSMTDDARNEYFRDKYERFRECLSKVNDITLDDFSHIPSFSYMMWTLQDAYEDKWSFYVVLGDAYEPITFDEFVRNMDTDTVYYIGKTIDYHM